MMVAQYTYYQWRPLGFRQAQNYMVYSLRDLIISCVAIDWNLELKSNFCIPLTFAMDNDDDNDDDAHNAVATVLGSQFGRMARGSGQRSMWIRWWIVGIWGTFLMLHQP